MMHSHERGLPGASREARRRNESPTYPWDYGFFSLQLFDKSDIGSEEAIVSIAVRARRGF